ncbi:MAG: alpha/beta hydrolase fold domain-containing protein, partial [Bacteroidales bacterium]|nr:alpha/beta hydrolase fold domain-containing protein [Bacteroidales bacterium]
MKRLLCILLALLVALGCAGKSYSTCTVRIESGGRSMKMKVLQPKETSGPVPGILWIHGGGYMLGGTYMLGMTCAPMLAERFGAVVVFPDYRLAWQSPYPAALED